LLFESVTNRIIVAITRTFVAHPAIVQRGEEKKSNKSPTSTIYHYQPSLFKMAS